MMTKSERHNLVLKKRKWDESLRKFDSWWRYIKRMLKKAMNWYWFDSSKSDGQKAFHIIAWIIVTLGIVGWWNLTFGN